MLFGSAESVDFVEFLVFQSGRFLQFLSRFWCGQRWVWVLPQSDSSKTMV